MDLSLQNMLDELTARVLSGPMHFRLLLQPATAILIGIRDGKLDARLGSPPFIWGFLSGAACRRTRLRSVLWRLRWPILIATVLDGVVQFLMFQHVRPLLALLLGTSLMGLPYSVARGLSNRVKKAKRAAGRI